VTPAPAQEALVDLLPAYLRAQRWSAAADRTITGVTVDELETLATGPPPLVWALVTAAFDDGSSARYQVVIGLRSPEGHERFLEGKASAVLGVVHTDDGHALAYDALVDPDLALALVRHIAPDEEVERVRPLLVEQSNTSVVYDERLILKLFRRVHDGPNPDAEVTRGLAGVGFTHISAPVAEWRRDGADLAVLREFLVGGSDGFHLALTSLRDLYDSRLPPADCGGDFGPDAGRLGQITAAMHLAMAEAFGAAPADGATWAGEMADHLGRLRTTRIDRERVGKVFEALGDVAEPGSAVRVHGDYHLGQVMRTDAGWYVLDFEGEPERPLEERRRPSSPLRDVAGMLRSFHYAAAVALREREFDEDEAEMVELGLAWERRNADAFYEGYLATAGIDGLLPAERDRDRVLDAFLLDKAVYEVAYEEANRPTWADIPAGAVERLLARA
jgi:maltokinase